MQKSLELGFKMDCMFHLQTNWQSINGDPNTSRKAYFGVNPKLPVECGKAQFSGEYSCLKYVIPTGFEFSVSVK